MVFRSEFLSSVPPCNFLFVVKNCEFTCLKLLRHDKLCYTDNARYEINEEETNTHRKSELRHDRTASFSSQHCLDQTLHGKQP
jgi:hypothetical protein